MNSTLQYYEKFGDNFIKETLNKQMQIQYAMIEKYLNKGSHILDAGCGSGRDSLYFKQKGYKVTAFDASKKMVEFASKFLKQEVQLLSFDELTFKNKFDAIWASASLLHIPKSNISDTINKLYLALKPDGVLYASFKHNKEEFIKDGRIFNSYTKESFEELIESTPFKKCEEVVILEDSRADRKGELWLNAILYKNSS